MLRSVGYPTELTPTDVTESTELYSLARRNKIGSLYMKVVSERGQLSSLTDQLQNRLDFQHRQKRALKRAVENMPGIAEYAMVKSGYDVPVDSKDIDFLVYEPPLAELEQHFLEKGYEFCGRSPSSFDVLDTETGIQLDIQDCFSLQQVSYFDERTIRLGITSKEHAGVTVPMVSAPADLAIIVIHSITEQLFILKEFYAAIVMLESFSESDLEEFFDIVDANNIGFACRGFFTLVRELSREAFERDPAHIDTLLERYPTAGHERKALRASGYETPHRYTGRTGILTVGNKLRSADFRRTLVGQIPRMANPAIATHIVSQIVFRRKREHYVHDTSDME